MAITMLSVGTLIISFFLGIISGLELPPDGLWLNCGLDFCQFPEQYCRVVNGRQTCESCTASVCNSLDDFPSQCYTKCKELEKSPPNKQDGEVDADTNEDVTGRLWIAIAILSSLLLISVVTCVILCKKWHDTRGQTRKHQSPIQETKLYQPLPTDPTPRDRDGDPTEITVTPGDINGESVVGTDEAGESVVPSLQPRRNRPAPPTAPDTIVRQATKRAGNIECFFSSKLMENGDELYGRHTEETTLSIEDNESKIAQPQDNRKTFHLADYHLIEQETTCTVNSNSDNDEDTRVKSTSEYDSDEKLVLDNIESQAPQRPRSSTGPRAVTPTAPLLHISSSLGSDISEATTGSPSADSGNFGSGSSSPTGSVDLKNNNQASAADEQCINVGT